MGVARQDHVDAFDTTGHFFVHVEPVVRQDDDQLGTSGANFVDHRLHVFVTDAERVFREHPARVCDGHVREGLTDHGHLHATALEEFVGLEQLGGFIPLGVKDVLAEGREGQITHDLFNALRAQREFPVEGHRIRLQRVHHVDHVLPFSVMTGVRAVPRVTAIQQQRIGAVGADCVYNGRHAVHAAHLTVGLRQRGKIVICQGVSIGRAILDPVSFAEISARDVRHLTVCRANTKVNLGLAEIDRFQLGVDVSDVDQADIAKRVELQKIVLRQSLLSGQLGPIAKARRTVKRRRSHRDLKKVAARNHERFSLIFIPLHASLMPRFECVRVKKTPPGIRQAGSVI